MIVEPSKLNWTPSESLALAFPEINQVTIYGTRETPLFRSRDVEALLGFTRLQYARDYTENLDFIKSKGLSDDGKMREQTLLTERGLYTLMFKSKVPMAEKFKTFTTNVLVELRLHGKATAEDALKRMETYEQKLEQVTKDLQKQNLLCEQYYMEKYALASQVENMKIQKAKPFVGNKGTDGWKLQLFREKYFKKLYVYLEPRPRELQGDLDDYDVLDTDVAESDVRVYSLSVSERGTRSPVTEIYIPPRENLKSLDEFIGIMFGVKTKKNRYTCSLEELMDALDEFEAL